LKSLINHTQQKTQKIFLFFSFSGRNLQMTGEIYLKVWKRQNGFNLNSLGIYSKLFQAPGYVINSGEWGGQQWQKLRKK
jgi:hypothetical protein